MEKITQKIQGSLCSLKDRIKALKKIENSGIFRQICERMDSYIKDKNSNLNPNNNINSNNNQSTMKKIIIRT